MPARYGAWWIADNRQSAVINRKYSFVIGRQAMLARNLPPSHLKTTATIKSEFLFIIIFFLKYVTAAIVPWSVYTRPHIFIYVCVYVYKYSPGLGSGAFVVLIEVC